MITRVIENWLINTNETNYITAFVQMLLHHGHKIKITHGALENGKDIISIDQSGKQYAFQLKTGNIDAKAWTKIYPQIDELVTLAIDHPSFDEEKPHYPYLVTNGEVNEFVREKIIKYNKSWTGRGLERLKICDIHDLLHFFLKGQKKFIPDTIIEFDLFIRCFLADGNDFLEKQQLYVFLKETFFGMTGRTPKKRGNAIGSSVIVLSYLLNHYQLNDNYYALFEAWTLLSANILRYANVSLKKEYWIHSKKLILDEILRNMESLKKETLELDNFSIKSIGENRVLKNTRTTIVLGTLAAYENYKFKNNTDFIPDADFLKLIKDNIVNLLFWGESAFPLYFNIIKCLENCNHEKLSLKIMKDLLLNIVNHNSLGRYDCLPNPYYDVHSTLENMLKQEMIRNKEIDIRFNFLERDDLKLEAFLENKDSIMANVLMAKFEKDRLDNAFNIIINEMKWDELPLSQFSGSSYNLKALTLMFAKRGEKEFIQKNWKKISKIDFVEFIPTQPEDYFLFETSKDTKGVNFTEIPKKVQSWRELVNESNRIPEFEIFIENLDLMNFFSIIAPYRMNSTITKILDDYYC